MTMIELIDARLDAKKTRCAIRHLSNLLTVRIILDKEGYQYQIFDIFGNPVTYSNSFNRFAMFVSSL